MLLWQVILGFLTLAWKVYSDMKSGESCKQKRLEMGAKFRSAVRTAIAKKETGELEDCLYQLGFSGREYGKLSDDKTPAGVES